MSNNGSGLVFGPELIRNMPKGFEVRSVELPDEFGTMYFRSMGPLDQDAYFANMGASNGQIDKTKLGVANSKLICSLACNEDGKKIFGPKDYKLVTGLPRGVVDEAAAAILREGKNNDDAPSVENWMSENHPDILKQFQEEVNPVAVAEGNS